MIGTEVRALVNGISALTSPLSPFLHCEDTVRSWQTAAGKRVLIRTPSCYHPDLRLPASRPMRDKRLLSKLSYLWYFVRAAPTDKPIMTFLHVEINKGGLTHLAVKTCGKTLIP